MSNLELTPEEIAFHQAVRAAQLGDAQYPTGHRNAGKTKAQVKAEIEAGTFVPSPEFIPTAEQVKHNNTAPVIKKSAVVAEKKDEGGVEKAS